MATHTPPRVPEQTVADIINAASAAAQETVLTYALRFEGREDYLPLARLAQDVQHAVVKAGTKRWLSAMRGVPR
jgi:hypothetical protein